MADVKIIDIDGEQWNIKDQAAQNGIKEILDKRSEILSAEFGGTVPFQGKMKYIGEDSNNVYYFFWWDIQTVVTNSITNTITVLPPDTTKDKILNLNLNLLQDNNSGIVQRTQHETGPYNSGMVTYLINITTEEKWEISGMGVLRRTK